MQRRRGLTLLELMLALSLTALILVAISMAIDLNLRVFTVRRTHVEEAQLARSTIRLIANDLRAVVQHNEQDFSAVESMLKSAIASAAADQASGLSSGGTPSSGDPQGGGNQSSGSNQSSGGGQASGGQQGSSSRSSGSSSSRSSSGGTSSGGGGGSSSGSSGGGLGSAAGSLSGSAGGSGTGSGASSDSGASSGNPTSQTSNTQDLATSVTPPAVAGLYGNQFELMLDIARLPRLDEYQPSLDPATATVGQANVKIPSDVKTVLYYLGEARDATNVTNGASTGVPGLGAAGIGNGLAVGLVRRELDRAVTQFASANGNTDALFAKAEVIAPEVIALEFRYFDGFEWFTEWDSNSYGGLPLAVEVILAMRPPGQTESPTFEPRVNSIQDLSGGAPLFRQVIRLPTAKPQSLTGMLQSSSMMEMSP